MSAAAKSLIENAANQKLVSIASCWEIAIKAGLGKIKLGEPSSTYLINAFRSTGFDLLLISLAHATSVETLPPHHKDPFDRLLVAQALAENVAIVSVDPSHDLYGVTRLW